MENFRELYNIDKLKSIYNKYSFKPIPTKVTFLDDNSLFESDPDFQPQTLKISWRVRDTYQVKTLSYQKIYSWKESSYKYQGLPEEQSDVSLRAISQNGRRSVLLKSKTDSKNSKSEQFLVIYDENGVQTTIDIKSINEDLQIIESVNFSSFVLNEDGTILLSVVEIQDKSNKDESSATAKEYNINSHEFKQSWGEKFSTIFHTSIAVINLETRKYILLDKVGVSLCQPFFFKSRDQLSYSIGCIGFQEVPYKLGLIYCTNRVSYLFGSRIPSDFSGVIQIEPEIYYGNSGNLSIRSPRVYHSISQGYDNKVVFLERNAGGAHDKAARLQQFDLETRKIRTIIDDKMKREVIKQPDGTVTYSDIGPVFSSELPQNCFTNDGKYIFFDSDTPFTIKSFVVKVQDGSVQVLNFPNDACQILEVKHDWICAIGSSINQLPNVYIGHFVKSEMNVIKWIPVDDQDSRILSHMCYGKFMFQSKHFPNKYVTGVWTSPIEMLDKSGPTVIIPHGGPHSHYSTCYYQSIALYSELGLKTCLVNYVGSTGVDQEYVEALLGKVGTTDVQDLYDSIQYMINNHHTDKDRIILNGGSHGGFLVTNISGQHPELNFLACIARNPVIDISIMSCITDIPDWNMAEALGIKEFQPLSETYPRNLEEMSQMYRVSPLSHIAKVKVPTLLLLGKEDLRVPYSPALLYHRLLKARGIETRCLVYDDVHDLYKINVDFDCFINVAKFIEKFIYYNSH